MRKVVASCVQMSCSNSREENIQKALEMTQKSAQSGADVVLLPELFERPYFCQERNYGFYSYAEEVEKNAAILELLPLSKKLDIVIIASIYEKCGKSLYNTAVVLESGNISGIYRKTHIPDDHYYQEKFYFTPGNLGFPVFQTKFGKIGVGVCWDQWFPEVARSLALNGAELIFYPTAIGLEPILKTDSVSHWKRVMQGHAAANLTPVLAANRIGVESVIPCEENAMQQSSICFYGSSFITDETGGEIVFAKRDSEEIISATFDLDELEQRRMEWGLFRDRRPEIYGGLTK